MIKFIELLQNKNVNIIKNLSIFIYKVFQKRSEIIFVCGMIGILPFS